MDGEQKEHENMKVLRASELLTRVAVPALLAKIDSLQLLMVDSYSIKNALGDAGINVRYMHLLSENTRLPYFC